MTQTLQEDRVDEEFGKRYLFFLRHFNDTDNIAPIIHAFLGKSRSHHAEVVLYDENYCGAGDRNLSLLSQEFPEQFNWSWLGNHFGLDFKQSLRVAKWQKRVRTILTVLACATVQRHRFILVGETIAAISDKELAESRVSRRRRISRWEWLPKGVRSITDIRSGKAGEALICNRLSALVRSPQPADLVIFDVVRSRHVHGYLTALRKLGCKSIICLPVSPLINYNVLREYGFGTTGLRDFLNKHDYRGFDALSYVDGLYLQHYRAFMKSLGLRGGLPEKTNCIGSLRYYPEWLRIRGSSATSEYETHEKQPQGQAGKKKLLVLTSRLKSNVNLRELQACLDWLAQAREFEIRVKGHTRCGEGDLTLQLRGLQEANAIDTSALVDWCDAIVFWGTSAALEGYTKGKMMFCIPFVSSNLNLYEYYQAGYIARCRDDLVLVLSEYARTGVAEPYNHDGIRRMLREVVQAGQSNWQDHIEFVLRYLQDNEAALSSASSEPT
jgi:hypothetical protein